MLALRVTFKVLKECREWSVGQALYLILSGVDWSHMVTKVALLLLQFLFFLVFLCFYGFDSFISDCIFDFLKKLFIDYVLL